MDEYHYRRVCELPPGSMIGGNLLALYDRRINTKGGYHKYGSYYGGGLAPRRGKLAYSTSHYINLLLSGLS